MISLRISVYQVAGCETQESGVSSNTLLHWLNWSYWFYWFNLNQFNESNQ